MTYFGPARDPPLGGSGRKTTTLVKDHKYFIPTKFHQNPSSGSGEEVENVESLRGKDGWRTDDGRCAMTIAHSSLRLWWAKKQIHKSEEQSINIQLTCSSKWGQFIHWYRPSPSSISCSDLNCSTRSMSRRWRSLMGSSPGRPFGLDSVRRTSSCVATETDWPGGSSLCRWKQSSKIYKL